MTRHIRGHSRTCSKSPKTAPPKKLSDKNTKQEMLEAYQTLAKQLEEKRAAELAPERRLEEKRAEEAASFPKDLEAAVAQAVKESTERLKLEARSREDIAGKQFEGERNVLAARNESLERANKDLLASNAKLAQQLEAAYQKVQDIAQKTVEGASQSKSLADLQKLLLDQSRKNREDKL